MGGLTGSMLMAVHALLVQQSALNATSNNIANANTVGYSREVPILSEASPLVEGNLVFGQGVNLQQIISVRDRLLQLRLNDQTSQQSQAQTQYAALQQVENLFSDSSHGIGADLTAFFNSINQLSTDPSSLPQRQAVLTAAANLADDFHGTVAQLNNIRNNLNLNVTQSVNQINQLTSQIATLNSQVATFQKLGQDPGAVQDQRDQLINQLAQIVSLSTIQTEQGDTLTMSNGTALVVGGQAFTLDVAADASGMQHIYSLGKDVTSGITGGSMAGLLAVRDQVMPSVFSALDDLAGGLATNFNAAHQLGFDLAGNPGQDLFSATAGAGAASSFSVLISDPALIAASSDGSVGSNGNLAQLLAVRNQALPSGQKPVESYANLIFLIGNATAQAKADTDAGELSLRQLQNQRNAVSGVSLDEETTNLIRFQHAFAAAARIITTVDELMRVVLSIGSP